MFQSITDVTVSFIIPDTHGVEPGVFKLGAITKWFPPLYYRGLSQKLKMTIIRSLEAKLSYRSGCDFFSLGLKSALEPQVCVVLSWKSKRSHSCFALLFSNIVTNAILHSQNQTASFEHWIWVASLDFNTKMSGLHTLYSCENGLHIIHGIHTQGK